MTQSKVYPISGPVAYSPRPRIKERKGWVSSYEPIYTGGRRPAWASSHEPQLKNFPQDRTVVIRPKRHEGYESVEATILPWLKEMNMKARTIQDAYDGERKVKVAVFRSAKKAAIFKLAWG